MSVPKNGVDPNTRQPLLKNGVAGDGRPGQNLFGTALRDNTKAFSSAVSGLLGLMGGSPASMMVGNGDIDVMIKALEQDGTADILSAPKVTTKSGSEAIIRVAETHRYPQDYEIETGQRTSPVVKPQDWSDFDIGVTLKVTPVVNPENNTIDLDLYPESMKFLDFDEYRVGSNGYGDKGTYDPLSAIKIDPGLYAKMPYFRRRSVETQVTIADGSTVVMGGLVDERTETFRDQVPFLGDIPYLGRLFRSEGSRSVKKNLVIYVTARQVDGCGLTSEERRLVQASREANGAL
jgi:general secretion pathway protein D